MTSPTIDILVPVWNNPFETRACLAAILMHSPGARLIIVDNGSSRETELMLEEFSEPLGDQGLFIKSERNIGLIAAINIGLSRSDSDYTIIVRPNVTVQAGWLGELVAAAETSGAGIVSPLFSGTEAPHLPGLTPGSSIMETCEVSLATLLLRTEMRMITGFFDEHLDGDEWCVKEYVRRVSAKGYRTCITSRLRLACSAGQTFGSVQRRSEMAQSSRTAYISRWGGIRHYGVYVGAEADAGALDGTVAALLDGARNGHRVTLFLHRRHYKLFRKMGWDALHTGMDLVPLSPLFPVRDLQRKFAALWNGSPDVIAACGCDGGVFPGVADPLSREDLIAGICTDIPDATGSMEEKA